MTKTSPGSKSVGSGSGRGGSNPGKSPNDDRSDVKNQNNPSHRADQQNRARQAGSHEDEESD